MSKSRTILLMVIAVAVGWIEPAAAGGIPWLDTRTAEDQAAVPPDVFAAYKEAKQTRPYLCHGEAFRKADLKMAKLTEKIRLRYRADFDVPRPDDPIIIPTTCPSPEDFPDYFRRVQANLDAVEKLAQILNRYPSPVNEKLAREDAVIRGLLLRRFRDDGGEGICFNRTLLGIDAKRMAELKREAAPLEEDFLWQPPFFEKEARLPARAFTATALTWGELKIRSARRSECDHYPTYALYRPLVDEDFALLSGTQLRGAGAYQFVTLGFPDDKGWTTNNYRYSAGAGSVSSVPVDALAIEQAEAETRRYILEPQYPDDED